MELTLYLSISPSISTDMGKMNVVLSDETEERFRRAVFERKGMKKGNISEALEEALAQWMDQNCEGGTKKT